MEQIDPDSKGWTVAISAPVKVGTNVIGVIIGYVKWSAVERLLAGIPVGQTGYVYVLDKNQRVVIHRDKAYYGKTPVEVGAPAVVQDAFKARNTFAKYEFKNPETGRMDNKLVGIDYPARFRKL